MIPSQKKKALAVAPRASPWAETLIPKHFIWLKLMQWLWSYLQCVPHFIWSWHEWISSRKRVLLGVLSGVPQISQKCWCQPATIFLLMTWLFVVREKAAAHFLCFSLQHLHTKASLRMYPDYSHRSLTIKSLRAKFKSGAGSNCGAQLCLNSYSALLALRVHITAAKVGHQK